mmetsp:Transcript_61918/g.114907  ORF Transcript_61918/g.114907 Transcript_61918/m.114907 type:complete len:478 (-) Transcript_61918:171-1604(-)
MKPNLSGDAVHTLTTSFIWYDYFCIPQVPGRRKMAAIESIPAYISKAAYLFVLAPSLMHNDLPSVVNKASWQERGWCRVEQSIFSLTRRGIADTAAIFIHHAGFVQESVPMQWLYALPHKGDFTAEDDRAIIEKMIGNVAEGRLARLHQKDNPFEWRFMKAVLRYVKGDVALQTNVRTWMADYSFGCLTDAGAPDGWQPIHFAACEGNSAVVSAIVAGGVSVDSPTLGRGQQVMAGRGLTPLMVAANYIPDKGVNVAMVRHLVSLHADINATTDFGQQVIHFAALGPGAAESLQYLIDINADVSARDASGEQPLHYCGLTNATSNVTRVDAIEILLKAGADPQSVGGDLGLTPWHFVVPTGSIDIVKQFLDRKCDPNMQLPPHPARDTLKAAIEKHERENIVATLAVHGEGLTPLMFAVWIGNWETCEVMLANGADVNLKTSTGRTAFEWLQENQVFAGPTYDILLKQSDGWDVHQV